MDAFHPSTGPGRISERQAGLHPRRSACWSVRRWVVGTSEGPWDSSAQGPLGDKCKCNMQGPPPLHVLHLTPGQPGLQLPVLHAAPASPTYNIPLSTSGCPERQGCSRMDTTFAGPNFVKSGSTGATGNSQNEESRLAGWPRGGKSADTLTLIPGAHMSESCPVSST